MSGSLHCWMQPRSTINIVFVRFQTKGMADDRLPPLVKLTLQVPLGPYAMGCRRLQVAGLSGMHETCRRV